MSSRESRRAAHLSYWFLFGGGTLLYAVVGGLRPAGNQWVLAATAAVSLVLYVWTWRLTRQTEVGEQRLPVTGLWSVRLSIWGTGLWAIAHLGGDRGALGRVTEAVGLAAACTGANLALASLPPVRGLAHFRRDKSFTQRVWTSLAAALAIAAPAAVPSVLGPIATGGGIAASVSPALGHDVWIWIGEIAGGSVALAVTVANTWRQARWRRFELGAADRAASALALGISILSVAAGCSLSGLLPPTTALPAAIVCIGLSLCWLASLHDTQIAAGALRAAAAVAFFGLPLLAACAIASQRLKSVAPAVAAVGVGLGIAAGFMARRLSVRLAPETARWLRTLRAAARAALEPESMAAINSTLVALQVLERSAEHSPELWRPSPQEVLRVDVAGYLHREPAIGPALAYCLARDEPEGVLRASLLEHVQVSRPEVRPVLAWLQARGAAVAIVVSQGDDDFGLLLLPRGNRRRELSWEEAHACGQVAGRLASILSLSAVLERAQQRESAASGRVTELQAELLELCHLRDNDRASRSNLSKWMAREATVGHFGATVREVARRLEVASKRGDNLLLQVPVGSNVVSWACWSHGLSPRAEGPVVVVDCSVEPNEESREVESLAPSEVLDMGQAGTIVLLHVHTLKQGRQEQWSDAIVDQTLRGAPPRCILTVPVGQSESLSELSAEAFDSALMRALRPQRIALPPVSQRPEDIRGLVLEHLCRSAIRREGSILGVDVFAMEQLVEYSWPGNERQLQSVVEVAAAQAEQSNIRVVDLWQSAAVPVSGYAAKPGIEPLPKGRRGRAQTIASNPSTGGLLDAAGHSGPGRSVVSEGLNRRRRRR